MLLDIHKLINKFLRLFSIDEIIIYHNVNILQPLQDQQRQLNERMAKMQHTLDVMSYQQKERDTNSNINRDMVMLVVLVVMIQVCTLCKYSTNHQMSKK